MFGPRSEGGKLNHSFPVNILGNLISPVDAVRNLGVSFDSDFSFFLAANALVRSYLDAVTLCSEVSLL